MPTKTKSQDGQVASGRFSSGRRGFLRKIGITAGAVGTFGPAITGRAKASHRTHMLISEMEGKGVSYKIITNDDSLEEVYSDNEEGDRVYIGSDGRSVAEGYVNGYSDSYKFAKQIEEIHLTAHEAGDTVNRPSGDVRITFEDGWGFTGDAAVDTWTTEKLGVSHTVKYHFEVKDGQVERPGDGTLESNDDVGIYGKGAIGYVDGGHDHWNTSGRLKFLRATMAGRYNYHFVRKIDQRW